MTPLLRYSIQYSPETKAHAKFFKPFHLVSIREAINEQLRMEPTVKTKNRFPLDESKHRFEESEWELRCGNNNQFRIFYKVDETARIVFVVGIGIKIREKTFFGGKEFIE